MPPEGEKQLSESKKEILKQWLDSQLTGKAAKALTEKLKRFEYGNVVNHEDLFSGEYTGLPGYSHDRRWMISEFIFNEKVNRLLDYKPTRLFTAPPMRSPVTVAFTGVPRPSVATSSSDNY